MAAGSGPGPGTDNEQTLMFFVAAEAKREEEGNSTFRLLNSTKSQAGLIQAEKIDLS